MQQENNTAFILYTSYYDILSELSNEKLGELFRAILEYKTTQKQPVISTDLKIAFNFIKNQLDVDAEKYNKKCEKARENGLKGGRPKSDTKKSNDFSKNQEKPNGFFEKHNDNDNDNVNDNDKEKEINKEKEKITLGEFKNIFLLEEQKEKLELAYGDKFNEAIDRLSNYIEANGKTYKDHYSVLRRHNWVWDKVMGKTEESQSCYRNYEDLNYAT